MVTELPDLANLPCSLALALPSYVSDMVEMTYRLSEFGVTFMYLFPLDFHRFTIKSLVSYPIYCKAYS